MNSCEQERQSIQQYLPQKIKTMGFDVTSELRC